MILAIETSTPVCSVALQGRNGRITEKRAEGKGVHSEKTFLFIKELFDREDAAVQDLDAMLFSNGPGSYTGLRIGAAAIKGLLFGRDVPLYTFSTLLSFAAGVDGGRRSGIIHAVIDARREHLYRQQCGTDFKNISEPEVIEISKLEEIINKEDVIVGTGWDRMSSESLKDVLTIGTPGISAVNLIKAYSNPVLRKYFKKADSGLFEPDYLTLSQINNSPIR
jgi:tRNA threonylcarbamoyladenosine biosynthesis protein TsaB